MKMSGVIFGFLVVLGACKSDRSTVSNTELYSKDKSEIKAYNLIDPLTANTLILENPKAYIPIQVSKVNTFRSEHIPNAQNIWRPDYGSDVTVPYGGLIPSKEKLQKLLQKLGYEEGKTLILYDAKANVDAFRFAWVLNLYGFDEFKIMNGGIEFWKISGLPTQGGEGKQLKETNFQLDTDFDDSIIASFNDVLEAIDDPNTLLVDTRESFEYKGLPYLSEGKIHPYKKGAFERGSIPTAINLNWAKLADLNGDHRIKSENDLRYDLDSLGIIPNKKIILYCQSGSRTSHTFYVLKHVLGYEQVKNYDGSWIEWSYKHSLDNSIPVIQSDEEKYKITKDSLIANVN